MINLNGISKIYKNKKVTFKALNDISISIDKGEFVAVLGKSGSGKSTLINIIGLLDDFDEGEYVFGDIDVSKISENAKAKLRNSKIGVVLQDYSLINHKSVLFNVMLPLYFDKRYTYGAMKKKAINMLELMGISEQARKKVVNLSGGQKQRVAIARAMINDPDIILADEPTGALDSVTTDEIMQVFEGLNQSGVTVVIITHDLDVANRCNRIIELADGKIIKDIL